jgi:hypothetical protein
MGGKRALADPTVNGAVAPIPAVRVGETVDRAADFDFPSRGLDRCFADGFLYGGRKFRLKQLPIGVSQ